MKKIVIIKLGTSIATTQRGKLDMFRVNHIAQQIKLLQQEEVRVILVISAAVACGIGLTNQQDSSTIEKHLLAGIGQAHVISVLSSIFEKAGLIFAQLLLTKKDLDTQIGKEKIKQIIQLAFDRKIVLVINENDIIELNSFSGNDFLASSLAQLIHASHLFFLSDIDGVYDDNLEIIKILSFTNTVHLASIEKKYVQGGVGGIKSKIQAARDAAQHGTITFISNGQTKNVLVKTLVHGEHIGTKIGGTV